MLRLRLKILAFLLTGFSLSAQHVRFRAVFGEEVLSWGLAGYTSDRGEKVQFSNLEFYLSDFVWTDLKGEKVSEPERVELLMADAEKDSMLIKAPVLPGKLCFQFGLDSATQVSGRMDGPLDPAKGMYWAWNTGYIQCRLEGNSSSSAGKKGKFEFHLGGYASPYSCPQNVCLDFSEAAGSVGSEVYLDFKPLLNSVSLKKTHSVLIPGKEALEMSSVLGKSFRTKLQQK